MVDIIFGFSSTFAIPFLFTLAIVFGALQLGSPIKNKAANLIIALVIAFFAATYSPFVTTLNAILPTITWFFIILFLIAFVLEVFGLRRKEVGPGSSADKMMVTGVVLFILLSLGISFFSNTVTQVPFIGSTQNLFLLVVVIFILIIFWAAYKVGAEGETHPQQQKGG